MIELINFSKDSYIFLLGCDSGNKIFSIEQMEINAEVLSLSLKYKGEIGLINSVLKYPILFSFLDVCETNSLLDI